MGFWDAFVEAANTVASNLGNMNTQNYNAENGLFGQMFGMAGYMSNDQLLKAYFDMQTETLREWETRLFQGMSGTANYMAQKVQDFGKRLTPEQYMQLQQALNSPQMQECVNRLTAVQKELTQRPKPGSLCPSGCGVSDGRCEGCVEKQKAILAAMGQLEELEKAMEDPQRMSVVQRVSKVPNKCGLCGAPTEAGELECPYCGTAYTERIMEERSALPGSRIERHQMLIQKAAAVYQDYYNWARERMELDCETMERKIALIPDCMKEYQRTLGEFGLSTLKMDAAEVENGARYYKLPVSEYISRVIADKQAERDIETAISPWYEILTVKDINEMSEVFDREREAMEREREIERQRQEKLTKIQNERYERQLERAKNSTPQYMAGGGGGYSGGSSRTCFNCTYYSAGAQKCAQRGNTTNAGDSCSFWALKN